MLNEMNNWHKNRIEEAKVWVSMYPFLRIKDNSVYPWLNTEEIDDCWIIHDLPPGWVVGFAKQLCDELLGALGEYTNDLLISPVKEKFGEMRIYHHFADKNWTSIQKEELKQIMSKLNEIINKYSYISSHTCVDCGEQAEIRTIQGWIAPYCNQCYVEKYKHD